MNKVSGPARALGIEMYCGIISLLLKKSGPARALGIEIFSILHSSQIPRMSGPARALGIEMDDAMYPSDVTSSGPARALGIEIPWRWTGGSKRTGRGLRGPWGLK